jgi:hypothetical protein
MARSEVRVCRSSAGTANPATTRHGPAAEVSSEGHAIAGSHAAAARATRRFHPSILRFAVAVSRPRKMELCSRRPVMSELDARPWPSSSAAPIKYYPNPATTRPGNWVEVALSNERSFCGVPRRARSGVVAPTRHCRSGGNAWGVILLPTFVRLTEGLWWNFAWMLGVQCRSEPLAMQLGMLRLQWKIFAPTSRAFVNGLFAECFLWLGICLLFVSLAVYNRLPWERLCVSIPGIPKVLFQIQLGTARWMLFLGYDC